MTGTEAAAKKRGRPPASKPSASLVKDTRLEVIKALIPYTYNRPARQTCELAEALAVYVETGKAPEASA